MSLDNTMLKMINDFYSFEIEKSALYNECFSHPSLDFHTCNPLAMVDGGQKCSFCNHAPGGVCKITCHISYFCLAVFGYRLGLGGEDVKEAIKNNLKTAYKELAETIKGKLGDAQSVDGEAQDLSKVDRKTGEGKMTKTKKEDSKKTKETAKKTRANGKVKADAKPKAKAEAKPKEAPAPIVDENGKELITIRQAATLYECSYHNMYVHVAKKKNLEKVVVGENSYVRKDDVLAMKAKNKK